MRAEIFGIMLGTDLRILLLFLVRTVRIRHHSPNVTNLVNEQASSFTRPNRNVDGMQMSYCIESEHVA